MHITFSRSSQIHHADEVTIFKIISYTLTFCIFYIKWNVYTYRYVSFRTELATVVKWLCVSQCGHSLNSPKSLFKEGWDRRKRKKLRERNFASLLQTGWNHMSSVPAPSTHWPCGPRKVIESVHASVSWSVQWANSSPYLYWIDMQSRKLYKWNTYSVM